MWYVTLNRATLQVRFSIFTFAFLMDKQYKRWIFLRIIEGYFFYGEIKCKQGVKIFEKHPNKMEIFSPYSRGSFLNCVLLFGFHFIKIFSRIIWKEVFVCIIYTRSTKFNAPCFRVYRQKIWKALILKFYDFWNENWWLLGRFWGAFQAVDFKAG